MHKILNLAQFGTLAILNYRKTLDNPAKHAASVSGMAAECVVTHGRPWSYGFNAHVRPLKEGIEDSPCIAELLAGEPLSGIPKICDPFDVRAAIVAQRKAVCSALLDAASQQGADPRTIARAELYNRAYRGAVGEGETVVDLSKFRDDYIVPEWQNIDVNRRTGLNVTKATNDKGEVTTEFTRCIMLEGVLEWAFQGVRKDDKPADQLRQVMPRIRSADLTVSAIECDPANLDDYLTIQMGENGALKEGAVEPDTDDTLLSAYRRFAHMPEEKKLAGDTVAFGDMLNRGAAQDCHPPCYLQWRYPHKPIIALLTDPALPGFRRFSTTKRADWQSLRFRQIGGKPLEQHNKTRENKNLPKVPPLNGNPAPIMDYIATGVYDDEVKPVKAVGRDIIKAVADTRSGAVQQMLRAIEQGDSDTLKSVSAAVEPVMAVIQRVPTADMADFCVELDKFVAYYLGETDTVPADTVPADTVPADTVPADTVPAVEFHSDIPADDTATPAQAVADTKAESVTSAPEQPDDSPTKSAKRSHKTVKTRKSHN